jgi:hypothetical protein
MFKRILGLILAAFLAGVAINSAEAGSYDAAMRLCRQKMAENPPQIEVLINYGKLKYDFSKEDVELVAVFKRMNPGKPVVGKIHGLTDISPQVAIDLRVSRQRVGKRYVCTIPKTVVVHAGFQNPTVYILKTLRKGSCPYRLALRHEQAHLDIGFTALTLLGKILKEQLPDIVKRSGPRISVLSDESNMATKMSKEYQSFMQPALDIFQGALIEEQGKLDTAENYKKEAKVCR